MTVSRQNPDGTWEPAEPLDFVPGYDAERYASGRWTVYRNVPHHADRKRLGGSAAVATGRTRLGLIFALTWRRLLKPVR
jgi:hypothetical protein